MTAGASFSRRLGRFASFNVAQHVWLAAISLVATPILYHRLGDAAYGLLAVVNLVAAQLSILEFGFGHATVRWVAQGRAAGDVARMSRTVSTSAWVFTATACIGAATLLTATDVLAERYFRIPPELLATGKTALRVGAAFFAAAVFGTLAASAWQGLQRFGLLNLVSGVAATAQTLGSVALVLAGYGVLHVLAWSVLLGLATLVFHATALRRAVPGLVLFARPDRRTLRDMAGFGLLLMLAGVFTQVFLSGGPLVLGHYVVVGALPFFTVPFGLYQRLNRMGYGVASALYPLVSELDQLSDAASLRRVFVSGTRVLLVAGVAAMAPAVLLASPFLSAWMGPGFAAGGGTVLELLFAAFALSLATTPSVELARGTGKAAWLVAYTTVLAVVNVGGVALLAPGWGAVGAGVAFLCAQAVGSMFLLARVGGRACLELASSGLAVTVAVAVAGTWWSLDLTSGPGVRLALAAALGATLAAMGLTWALTAEERAVLRRMLARS